MQVMLERGFLDREQQGRGHLYTAGIAREDTQDRPLDGFLQGTFGGSAKGLVMRALGNHKASGRHRRTESPDRPDRKGRKTSEQGSVLPVRLLLAAGADPDQVNSEGLTARELARAAGHDDILRLLT